MSKISRRKKSCTDNRQEKTQSGDNIFVWRRFSDSYLAYL